MVKEIDPSNELTSLPSPPLPSDLVLPPLPPIPDIALRAQAFTHVSSYGTKRVSHDLDVENYAVIPHYEKLEFVGDSILGSAVTCILQELYPNMREGVATMLYGHMVRNDTLAQLADRYGLTDKLVASPEVKFGINLNAKIRGSLFEAYIAGLYYSHLWGHEAKKEPSPKVADTAPETRVSDTAEEVKAGSPTTDAANTIPPQGEANASPSFPTAEKEDAASEAPKANANDETASAASRVDALNLKDDKPVSPPAPPIKSRRTPGQAFDYIYNFLAEVFTPMAAYFIRWLQVEQKRILAGVAGPTPDKSIHDNFNSQGAKAALHLYTSTNWGVLPVFSSIRTRPGYWMITCKVVHPDGREWAAEAERPTKKLGCSVAAYEVCRQLKLCAGPRAPEPVQDQ